MTNSDKLKKIARILVTDELSEETKIESIIKVAKFYVKDRKVKKTFKYTIDEIKDQVCSFFGVTLEDINLNSNKHETVFIRQIAHFKSWMYTNQSLGNIGIYFGNKNHSTVLNSRRMIKNYLDTDKSFREKYQNFLEN